MSGEITTTTNPDKSNGKPTGVDSRADQELASRSTGPTGGFAESFESGADESDAVESLIQFARQEATKVRQRIQSARRADIEASGELVDFADRWEERGLRAAEKVMGIRTKGLRGVRSRKAVDRVSELQGILDEAEERLAADVDTGFALAGEEIDRRLESLYKPALTELRDALRDHTTRISGTSIINKKSEQDRIRKDLESIETRLLEKRKSVLSDAADSLDDVVQGVRSLEQRASFASLPPSLGVRAIGAPEPHIPNLSEGDVRVAAHEEAIYPQPLRLHDGDQLVETHEEAIYPQPLRLSEGDIRVEAHEEAIYPQPLRLRKGDVRVDAHDEAIYPQPLRLREWDIIVDIHEEACCPNLLQPLTLERIDLTAADAAERIFEIRYASLYQDLKNWQQGGILKNLNFASPEKKPVLGRLSGGNGNGNYFKCEITPANRGYVIATLYLSTDPDKHLHVKWKSNKITEFDPTKYESNFRGALIVGAHVEIELCEQMKSDGSMRPDNAQNKQRRPKEILAAYAPAV